VLDCGSTGIVTSATPMPPCIAVEFVSGGV
jgi:hypothetical protein